MIGLRSAVLPMRDAGAPAVTSSVQHMHTDMYHGKLATIFHFCGFYKLGDGQV